MIAYLRSQLSGNTEHSIHNPFFFQNTAPTFNYDGPSTISAISHSAISNIPEVDFPKQMFKQNEVQCNDDDDSLSFSRDKSKDFESIHSAN